LQSIFNRSNQEENMKKIRYGLLVVGFLLCLVTSATAGVSIGIGLPNVSIGINLPLFPELVPVPGYPVYYAPQVAANYFFYDGMYWVYQDDNWYASSWYNGPWGIVQPEVVPLFILRIPVRYYRQPPIYFREWQSNAPPRWGQHWGRDWEQKRRGWDRWNRGSAPSRAPLPVYQRQYTGDRYPRQLEQQRALRSQSYRYQPRDRAVREHFREQQGEHRAPAPDQRGRQDVSPGRGPGRDDLRQQRDQRPQMDQRQQREQRPQIDQRPQREQGPQFEQRPQREQRQQIEQRPQERGPSQESNQGHGQGQRNDEERGQGRNR
jgi:hypothetical protein